MNAESFICNIDGTLWDSRAKVAEGYNIQLRSEGLSHLCVTKDDLTPLFGKVMTAIADVILGSIEPPERYALMERCMNTENEYLKDHGYDMGYPKVKETLQELKKKHRLFIVSNSQCGYPEVCIKNLELEGLIEGHLCFGDTGTSKVNTIQRLMEKHNIQSAIYIGDTQGDLEACEEAGIPFVFCTFGLGQADHWDAKIDAFEELLEL